MRALIIAAAAMLAGCAVPSLEERCASFGFRPGTDAMAHCVMTTHQGDAALVARQWERAADAWRPPQPVYRAW